MCVKDIQIVFAFIINKSFHARTDIRVSIKNVGQQGHPSFITKLARSLLINSNSLGCDCLAGCSNQLTEAKSLIKNVYTFLWVV